MIGWTLIRQILSRLRNSNERAFRILALAPVRSVGQEAVEREIAEALLPWPDRLRDDATVVLDAPAGDRPDSQHSGKSCWTKHRNCCTEAYLGGMAQSDLAGWKILQAGVISKQLANRSMREIRGNVQTKGGTTQWRNFLWSDYRTPRLIRQTLSALEPKRIGGQRWQHRERFVSEG